MGCPGPGAHGGDVDLEAGPEVDSGGGSSSDTRSSSSSEIGESLSGSDGEEQYSTDVIDTRLGRAMGSDSDEFSTDVSDSRKRRRREGGLGKEATTYPAREGASGALGLL